MGWTGLILSFLGVLFGGVSAYYAHVTYQHDRVKQHQSGEANPDWRYRSGDARGSRLWKYGLVVGSCILLTGVLLIIHPGGSLPPASGSQSTQHPRGSSSNGATITQSSSSLPSAEYMPLWSTSVSISLFTVGGVTFQQNGAVITFSSDISYGGTWSTTTGSLDEWNSNIAPTPSNCVHEQGVNTAAGTTATIGAKYCYVNTGSPNGPIVVVLAVTGTSQTGVIFNARAWAPKS
jgi:hypothetical protein